MKTYQHKHPLFAVALSLSLALLSCNPPASHNGVAPPVTTVATQNISQRPELEARTEYNEKTRELKVHIQTRFTQDDGFKTQAINCTGVTHFLVRLQGLGFPTEGIYPDVSGITTSNTVSGISGGSAVTIVNTTDDECNPSGSVATFSNVVKGKSRVISVEALRPDALGVDDYERISGLEVRAVFDLGASATVVATPETTPVATIMGELFQKGPHGKYLFSKIDTATLSTFVSSIYPSSKPYLVKTQAVADDIIAAASGEVADNLDIGTLGLNSTNAKYDLVTSQVNVTVSGGINYPLSVRVNDLSSSATGLINSSGSSSSIVDVAPGKWELIVTNTGGAVVSRRVIDVDGSGGPVGNVINLSSPAPTANWQLANGPVGGFVHSLVKDSGTIYLAGTDYGLYRTTNIDANPWVLNNDLQGKKILSLYKDVGGTVYAGVNAKEIHDATTNTEAGIYVSIDNGNTWAPINDNDVENIDVHDIVKMGSNIYAATSDGVVELNTGNWSKVNNGLPTAADRLVTDLEVFNTTIYATFPSDSSLNYIYQSTSPGTGWGTLGGSPNSTVEPISITAISPGTLYMGGRDGNVYYLSGPNWIPRSSNQNGPGAPAAQLFSYADGGGVPNDNIMAITNGQITNVDAAGAGVQRLTNTDPTTSFASDNWQPVPSGPGKLPENLFGLSYEDADFDVVNRDELFIGTAGGGVLKSTQNTNLDWIAQNNELIASHINEIIYAAPYAYVATEGAGVHRYHTTTGVWDLLNDYTDSSLAALKTGKERYPKHLAIDSDNTLYAWNSDGLFAFRNANNGSPSGSWISFNDGIPGGSQVEGIEVVSQTSGASEEQVYLAVSGGNQGVYARCKESVTSTSAFCDHTGFGLKNFMADQVWSIAVAPSDPDRVFIGTSGQIKTTTSAGAAAAGVTWTDVYSPNLTSKITHLDIYQTSQAEIPRLFFVLNDNSPTPNDKIYTREDDGAPAAPPLELNIGGGLGRITDIELNAGNVNQLFIALKSGGIRVTTDATNIGAPNVQEFKNNTVPPNPASNVTPMSALRFFDNSGGRLLAGSLGRGLYKTSL